MLKVKAEQFTWDHDNGISEFNTLYEGTLPEVLPQQLKVTQILGAQDVMIFELIDDYPAFGREENWDELGTHNPSKEEWIYRYAASGTPYTLTIFLIP